MMLQAQTPGPQGGDSMLPEGIFLHQQQPIYAYPEPSMI